VLPRALTHLLHTEQAVKADAQQDQGTQAPQDALAVVNVLRSDEDRSRAAADAPTARAPTRYTRPEK
jgi:hypothetical protein